MYACMRCIVGVTIAHDAELPGNINELLMMNDPQSADDRIQQAYQLATEDWPDNNKG